MLNEAEKETMKKILYEYVEKRSVEKIDIEGIETNCKDLSMVIYLLHCRQYYPEGLSITELKIIEKKLWDLYYKITGKKHQNDLFDSICKLSDLERECKIVEIANDKRYDNLYFADISIFNKCYFSYAAEVIIKRGYPEVENVIPKLFVWLQDINWPGSYDIFKFLCTIPKEAILKYFEDIVSEAVYMKDESWLYYLQQLMYHFKLTENDFKDKKLFTELNREIEY